MVVGRRKRNMAAWYSCCRDTLDETHRTSTTFARGPALPWARPSASTGGRTLPTAGLSADPAEYRARLGAQPEEQLDAWMIELMRDMSIRRGVLTVLAHVPGRHRRSTTAASRRSSRPGEGAPGVVGRTADGQLMVPAISLHHLVPGLRAQSLRAHDQLVDFLVDGFHEVVYI